MEKYNGDIEVTKQHMNDSQLENKCLNISTDKNRKQKVPKSFRKQNEVQDICK